MRKIITILLCIIIIFTLTSCQSDGFEESKDKQIIKLLNEGKIELAKDKVKELYVGKEQNIKEWLESIDKYNPTTNNITVKDEDSLVIQNGWTWDIKGDHTYVKGRVKNIGDKNVKYFEVTAEYLDENEKVLDTDYTNSGEIIKPDNMKEFEIMHKYNSDYNKVRIFVNKVSFE